MDSWRKGRERDGCTSQRMEVSFLHQNDAFFGFILDSTVEGFSVSANLLNNIKQSHANKKDNF